MEIFVYQFVKMLLSSLSNGIQPFLPRSPLFLHFYPAPFNARFDRPLPHASSFLEALASFSRFFSGTDFPEKAFARTNASFLFIFILFFL